METIPLFGDRKSPGPPIDIRDICRDALVFSSDGIVCFDSAGDVTDFDRKFADLLGVTVTTGSCARIFPAECQPRAILADAAIRIIRDCTLTLPGRKMAAQVEFIKIPEGMLAAIRLAGDTANRFFDPARQWIDAILDSTDSVIAILDTGGRFVRFNRAAQRLTGFSEGEMLGQCVWDALLFEEDIAAVREVFAALRDGRGEMRIENRWKSRDGSSLNLLWSNVVIGDSLGNAEYIISTAIDVTSARRTESALAGLSGEFLAAQSEKRRSVSRYLHDTLSQHLVTLALSVSRLERNPSLWEPSAFREAIDLVDRCCRDLRVLSCALAPPIVDDESPWTAFEWYARQLRDEAGIDVEFEGAPAQGLFAPEAIELLVAIFQEWGERAIRYPGPGKTRICLSKANAGFDLEFSCDRSDDRAVRAISDSAVIRERVRALGGSVATTGSRNMACAHISVPEAAGGRL